MNKFPITSRLRSSALIALLSTGLASAHLQAAAFTADADTVYLWNFDTPDAQVFSDQVSDVELRPDGKTGVSWADGKFGKALSLPGDTLLRTRINDKNVALENAVTVECWINLSDMGSESQSAGILENFDFREKRGFRLALTRDKKVRWMVQTSDGEKSLTSARAIPLGGWVHIAATYDGQNMAIYIQGALDSEKAEPHANLGAPERPVVIGFYNDASRKGYFQGMIEGLRVSRVARTEFKLD